MKRWSEESKTIRRKLETPFEKTEQNIYRGAALYPGAKRTGDWELTYVADDAMEIIRAYVGMRR